MGLLGKALKRLMDEEDKVLRKATYEIGYKELASILGAEEILSIKVNAELKEIQLHVTEEIQRGK